MGRFTELLDTPGGHIIVALFIFLVGVGLAVFSKDLGKEITVGALASLWTALRTAKGKDKDDGNTTG